MEIVALRIVTLDIPLKRPIVMGAIRFDSREYVLVEVRTNSGVSGIGFGMTRNAPVASIIRRNLAPQLFGEDPLLIERLWERMYYANYTIGQRGIFMRALSVVDIALWDLKGRVAAMPVWQMLGGARTDIPCFVAGGYPAADRGLDDLEREMNLYRSLGFRNVKIAAGTIAEDTERLRTARSALGWDIDLSIDVHWSWRHLQGVVEAVRSWMPLGLAFIEDPFPSEQTELAVRLRDATGCSIALGEDTVGRWAFADLILRGRPDVLRIDATVAGGFSESSRICGLSAASGIPVLPHVFPEVHAHLAAAYPGVMGVELTWPGEDYEGLYRIFREWVAVDNGRVRAPTGPGLGIEVDWDKVSEFSVEVLEVLQ